MRSIVLKTNMLTLVPQFSPLYQNPAAVYLSQLAPGSRRTMKQALNAIALLVTSGTQDAFSFEWQQLRYQHTAAIRSALMEKYAPATANKMLAAMKRTLREAQRMLLMTAEDYARAVDIQPIKGQKLLKGRALSAAEISTLLNACTSDPTPTGLRDAAMLCCLRVGLRRSEVVGLDLNDFEPLTGALVVLSGKGRKDRVVYLPHKANAYVVRWVELRGNPPGALLLPVNKSNRIAYRRLTDQAVLTIMRSRAKKAGIDHFTPHDFRRTFISDMLDSGVDISTVQQLAGHADPSTTIRYDRRGEDTKRKAIELLSF